MPVTLSVPITPWYIGQTLPVPTIYYTDDSKASINLTGATLTLILHNIGTLTDTNGAGSFTIVNTLATLSGSTISAGATVTSLPCSAGTSVALPVGSQVVASAGTGNAETFTYSGTSTLQSGATSIPVLSQVAAKTHSSGDSINGLGLATYAWATADSATLGSYLLYFKVVTSGGGVFLPDPVSWVVNAV